MVDKSGPIPLLEGTELGKSGKGTKLLPPNIALGANISIKINNI